MTHDAIYLREACRAGIAESQDKHTQNGALLRSARGIVITAANRLPPIVVTENRLERPEKYMFIEHAERNVIYAAARAGIGTHGATLYCPWFACADCARAIIQCGVAKVVGHVKPRLCTPTRWKSSIAAADAMLWEAGVEMLFLDEPLGVSYLFNGEPFEL